MIEVVVRVFSIDDDNDFIEIAKVPGDDVVAIDVGVGGEVEWMRVSGPDLIAAVQNAMNVPE